MNYADFLMESNILVGAMYQAFEKYEGNSNLKDRHIDCC